MRLARLAASLLLILCAAAAAEDSWRLEKEADGIQVYSRAVEGWAIRETRSSSQINARLGALVAVLSDLQTAGQLNPFVKETRLLSSRDATHYDFYTHIDLPWPMSDRDIVNRHSLEQDAQSLTVTIVDEAVTGLVPEQKDLTRIVKSHQQWTLTPAGDGKVMVELRLLSDPGGSLPASFLNATSVSTPMKTIAKLRELAQQSPYREARPAFIRDVR